MNTLVAKERNDFRKSTLKRLRNNGGIPAVVYGSDMNTESVSIKHVDLLKVMREVGRNGILSLDLNGKSKNVLVRDYQNDPINGKVLHVDFLQVEKNTEIDTKVSVILKGTSQGEKQGGMAKQFLHELDITAKANDIPDMIEIDITDFDIGHTVQVTDIKKDYSNCTFHHEDEETIVTVDYVKPDPVSEEEETEAEVAASED